MKSFRDFIQDQDQDQLQERLIRKGAVSAYAVQGKKHGDTANRKFRDAKNVLNGYTAKSSDGKLDSLATAIFHIADGMMATRDQIGSVSAQITASTVLK